jgi:hypothetical protein
MKSRAMAKNAKPNRIPIKLPMIGYAEFNNKPLSASSRCLLMKDKAPRETKPAPKTKSPALVDSFSKSRGVFMFESGHTLIAAGTCYPFRYWSGSPTFRGGCSPIFWLAARRRAAGRLRNEPEQAGCVVFESGLVLLVSRQKANTVPSLATNLCYGGTVIDRNVSSDCLCSKRINRVQIPFGIFTPA